MRWNPSFTMICENFFIAVENNNKMFVDIKVSLLSVLKYYNLDKTLRV